MANDQGRDGADILSAPQAKHKELKRQQERAPELSEHIRGTNCKKKIPAGGRGSARSLKTR